MKPEESIIHLKAAQLMLLGKDNQPVSDLYYALQAGIDALEKAPAVSEMTTLVTLSDGYGHVREAYYDKVRQLVFTECFSVKDLNSRYININERKELNDNEDSQL